MTTDVISVVMEHSVQAGVMGPNPVVLDIRAFLVPHPTGLVMVDTGMDPSGGFLNEALDDAGATWSDLSHVVITHAHPDHVAAIERVRASAPNASLLAHPHESIGGAAHLHDGDIVGSLRVFATPGHTPGHLSLIDEDRGILLVGDCVGTVAGELVRAPQPFTADTPRAEESLHRLLDLRGARILSSHGPELDDPWDQLDALLA